MSVNTRILLGWVIGFACGIIATIAFALCLPSVPTATRPESMQSHSRPHSKPTIPPMRIPKVLPSDRNPYGRYNI